MTLTLILVSLAIAAVVAAGLNLNTSYIPGPYDAELVLESGDSLTKTADYSGAAFDLGDGYAPGGIGQPAAIVAQVSALDSTTGDETYSLKVQESDDDDTWNDAGPSVSVSATGAVSVPAFISKRYCRLSLDVGGTTPSITYKAHLVPLDLRG